MQEASELFFRIAHEDSEERMPPPDAKRQLKPQEIKLIEQWIEGGAEWEQRGAGSRQNGRDPRSVE